MLQDRACKLYFIIPSASQTSKRHMFAEVFLCRYNQNAMSHFHPDILLPDPSRRARILPVLDAALDAVEPGAAVRRTVHCRGDSLQVGEFVLQLDDFRRVFLLAFGKAAAPMAQAMIELGVQPDGGVVITNHGNGPRQPALLAPLAVVEAGHPTPDAAGVAAARRVAAIAEAATADDLIIALVSGGGSALLTLPAPGLSLADVQKTTTALLACGASIDEINAVRKHLSQVKGGQLARLAAPAQTLVLALSDVVGNPLHVIASGPFAPDPSTWDEAWAVIEKYHLAADLPEAARRRLLAGKAGRIPDTPKPCAPLFQGVHHTIVADNVRAADAAAAAATAVGFNAAVLSAFIQGEAQEVAQVLVGLGREIVARQRPLAPPACLILGGETTVTLRGPGKGGRNQEMALAAALALARAPEAGPIIIAALATDGGDGPTNAAGGLADASSVARGAALGLDAQRHLRQHNSYPWLQAIHDQLITGPTHTNVNDLCFVFVMPG